MKLHVLASGSKGNATLIEGTNGAALIDCGINKKTLNERFEQAAFDAAKLCAVIITHEHTDHIGGLGVCHRGFAKLGLSVPIYATAKTQNAGKLVFSEVSDQLTTFSLGETLNIAGLQITGFATSHDAAEPAGFRIEESLPNVGDAKTTANPTSSPTPNTTDTSTGSIGYLTDSGELTADARECLQNVDLLALECNHDFKMLQSGPYPYYLQQRVGSATGHLSNAQAAAALDSLLWDGLHTIIGMHLSQINNDVSVAKRTLQEKLDQNQHPAKLLMASQFMAVSPFSPLNLSFTIA